MYKNIENKKIGYARVTMVKHILLLACTTQQKTYNLIVAENSNCGYVQTIVQKCNVIYWNNSKITF